MATRTPLMIAFRAAVQQATQGKGERHGGESVPFYHQQWVTLANCHGLGVPHRSGQQEA